jgi:hypothetical protein
MDMEQLETLDLIKAITAAAGGSITFSNEVYDNYASMDLDAFVLEFESDDDGNTVMTLRYRTSEESY